MKKTRYTPEQIISKLREAEVLLAKGMILIDDGYLVGKPPGGPGWENYAPLEETEQELTRYGDRIETRLDRRESMAAFDRAGTAPLKRRAENLARRLPELAAMIGEYLDRQYGEIALWNTDLMPAMWCLRRA